MALPQDYYPSPAIKFQTCQTPFVKKNIVHEEAYKNMDTVEDDVRIKAEEINAQISYQNGLLKLNKVIPLRTDAVEEERKGYEKVWVYYFVYFVIEFLC